MLSMKSMVYMDKAVDSMRRVSPMKDMGKIPK